MINILFYIGNLSLCQGMFVKHKESVVKALREFKYVKLYQHDNAIEQCSQCMETGQLI